MLLKIKSRKFIKNDSNKVVLKESINKELKKKLEYHYRVFNRTQISPDPLEFPHKYKEEGDIELIGFLSSVFAYGNVKQIILTLNKLNYFLGNEPLNFLLNLKQGIIKKELPDIRHRFYTVDDIELLLMTLKNIYKRYGLLKNLFYEGYNAEDKNLKNSITSFHKKFLEQNKNNSRGFEFMFPLPDKGSACKRINLFLRWMVRNDDLDFGLWNKISTRQLVIPVDIHIASIAKKLELTTKKHVSWKMAEEITDNLKIFNQEDPVRYDFALCHIGMRKLNFDKIEEI